jgi:triacylglycerol lipase
MSVRALPALFALSLLACSSAATQRAVKGAPETETLERPPVVLLHGLALTASAMNKLASGLEEAGFRTCAIDYPSREHPIDTLVVRFILPGVRRCFPKDTAIHFVTHSMGGILLRKLETLPDAPRIARSVLIAPPNQGSEVVDSLRDWWAFDAWNGPAGSELGTDSNSVPNRLGPPKFEFGVIAATRSVDPIFSLWIPGPDDGKVAVERTKLDGMRDFTTIAASHTFVLWKDVTVKQVVEFLKTGRFGRG